MASLHSRRRLLQFGSAGVLGLSLGSLWRAQMAAGDDRTGARGRVDGVPGFGRPIRACILVFYYGGPSHLDTWDMKPQAPAEIRGSFQSISTTVPGLHICEHLPRMARWMHKVAVIRSVHHQASLHDSASIHALTGRPLDGPDRELFAPLPQFYPSFGSTVAWARREQAQAVPYAALPYIFQNVVPTPCQGGGILSANFDPLSIDVDVSAKRYRIESLGQRDGMDATRHKQRLSLLESLGSASPLPASLSRFYSKAYQLLESQTLHEALDIERESDAVRQRYGFYSPPTASGEVNGGGGEMGIAREMRGQNLLLARRLVEAGVPFVNVYDYKQQGQNWDAHVKCEHQHKEFLLPPADQALSALIEDLDQRGLLDSTLVVAMGEFGRTPKINAQAGRDHWPHCYSVIMAGGGITGGAIWGASDQHGGYPSRDPVTPGDIAATIYWRFGVDHSQPIHDHLGRPHRLALGEPIRGLFT
ncbi:MAG: DUF1501 domain-containing protein [Pirellulaceae bacterium]|nr:DUF1501 domain-containing protein [Pirellulaceae bacterium]